MKINDLVRTIGIFRAKAPRTPQPKDGQRAEEVWRLSQHVEAGAEYPFLCAKGDNQVDGLWLCHCRHENRLVHYAGLHPFKHLRCGKCEHIMCGSCLTSAILTPLKQVTAEALKPQGRGPPNFCWVCQHCGLSHRATASESATRCGCDHSLKDCTQGYHIGSIQEYRSDPEGAAVTLAIQGRHNATKDQRKANASTSKPGSVNFSRPFKMQERVLARTSSEPEMREVGPSPLKQILMSRPNTPPRPASGSDTEASAEFDDDWTDEEIAWFYGLL